MPKHNTKPLGSDKSYVRPKSTYQEQLSSDDISEMLSGYQRVDDISTVPVNCHIRYFTNIDGEYQFRTGGFLHNKENADKYVILSNGKFSWSVQTNNSVFYKKMSHAEEIESLHRLYRKKLKKKDREIDALKAKLGKKN